MNKKKRVSCVILNYNDAKTTEQLVRKIYAYSVLDAVVIVDNCSTDRSFEQLCSVKEKLDRQKISVIKTKKNGGYGAGNNAGINYSYQVLKADYVLIANPDVEFSEETVVHLLGLFNNHPSLAAASALMKDPVYGSQKNGWPLLGFWGELARSGPLCRRIFRSFLEYREDYFDKKKAVYVGAVHGSMLMIDAAKMIQCRGFDEGIFLYQEEVVLGCRMSDKGYRTALLLTDFYTHHHSKSISKTYQNLWERQKLRNQSAMYYYQNYLKINHVQELAAKIFFQIIHLEIWFCSRVLKINGEKERDKSNDKEQYGRY